MKHETVIAAFELPDELRDMLDKRLESTGYSVVPPEDREMVLTIETDLSYEDAKAELLARFKRLLNG